MRSHFLRETFLLPPIERISLRNGDPAVFQRGIGFSNLTSCYARRESFVPKLQYSLSFKYISVKQNRQKQIINLLLLDNFYQMISYRRVQKESDELFAVYGSVTRYDPQSVASARG